MQVTVRGCGVVGARAARQLLTVDGVSALVLSDPHVDLAPHARSFGASARVAEGESWHEVGSSVVLLSGPAGHVADASMLLRAGCDVVSTSDDLDDIRALLALDEIAKSVGRRLVVGAGFSPGLTCVLAKHASSEVARVDEVHVAKMGTAGPACARQHHRALHSDGVDWRDGSWVPVTGGSGRELCWFPDPIAGADCYRAALAEPLLLHRLFPESQRLTGRMAATRRDRFTARLPMLRKPHAEAGAGAVRVELRGTNQEAGLDRSEVIVLGCMDRPSIAAATVAALAVGAVVRAAALPGAMGLAELVEPAEFLRELSVRGVKCARFEGAPSHSG